MAQFIGSIACGHTTLNTPVPIWTPKLSNVSLAGLVLGWVIAWESPVLQASFFIFIIFFLIYMNFMIIRKKFINLFILDNTHTHWLFSVFYRWLIFLLKRLWCLTLDRSELTWTDLCGWSINALLLCKEA